MRKTKQSRPDPDLRDEYDFSGGVRGKYAKRFAAGCNVVILDPDVARRFADSASVNKVLRSFMARSGKKRSRA